MPSTFASSVKLVVTTKPADMSRMDAYLLETLVSEWQKGFEKASNESHRGNLRLEKFLENNDQGVMSIQDMSERLQNQIPYGMAEGMRV